MRKNLLVKQDKADYISDKNVAFHKELSKEINAYCWAVEKLHNGMSYNELDTELFHFIDIFSVVASLGVVDALIRGLSLIAYAVERADAGYLSFCSVDYIFLKEKYDIFADIEVEIDSQYDYDRNYIAYELMFIQDFFYRNNMGD